ncbi:MAG: CdaR family protein [Fimbriimonadaceae bacterium]|nr:CdaR family protein [Fimbriimonadaceae bacterium]
MTFGKFALFLGSLAIALLMWLQVVEKVSTKAITVSLELTGLPRGLVIPYPQEYINVTVRGSNSEVSRLDPSLVKARINLSGAKPGQVDKRVILQPPPGTRLEFTANTPQIRLIIEREAEIEMPVTVIPQGVPIDGYVYNGATTFPRTVKVMGAESLLPRISQAQAVLNLVSLQPGDAPSAEIRLIDNENQPVPSTRIIPDRVAITPSLELAPSARRVLVVPTFVGQPRFGYQVRNYTIEPPQVELRGPSAVLSGRLTVETEPLTLTGLNESRTRTVPLRLPTGVTADVREVTITLEIVAVRSGNP